MAMNIKTLVGYLVRRAHALVVISPPREGEDYKGSFTHERLEGLREELWRERMDCECEGSSSERTHWNSKGGCNCGFGEKFLQALNVEAYWGYLPDKKNLNFLRQMGVLTPVAERELLRTRGYQNLHMHVGYHPDAVSRDDLAKAGVNLKCTFV